MSNQEQNRLVVVSHDSSTFEWYFDTLADHRISASGLKCLKILFHSFFLKFFFILPTQSPTHGLPVSKRDVWEDGGVF